MKRYALGSLLAMLALPAFADVAEGNPSLGISAKCRNLDGSISFNIDMLFGQTDGKITLSGLRGFPATSFASIVMEDALVTYTDTPNKKPGEFILFVKGASGIGTEFYRISMSKLTLIKDYNLETIFLDLTIGNRKIPVTCSEPTGINAPKESAR